MHRTKSKLLTDQSFWGEYWSKLKLPVEMNDNSSTPFIKKILKVFKTYLPNNNGLTCLEIGAAPGGYLAYMARTLGYKVYALDNSQIGCQKLRENFRILGIPVKIYCRDICSSDISDLPKFDIVYSLGLIEHFSDPLPVIHKHIQLIKPSGTLLLGVPNFLGINRLLLRALKPKYLSWHNLNVMNIKSWNAFEKELGLTVIFKGYVGGWEPRIYFRSTTSLINKAANKMIRMVATRWDKFETLRKLNSKWWSGYAIMVCRKFVDDDR